MKTWKRALALVLALVMALSLVALPSFAEGEGTAPAMVRLASSMRARAGRTTAAWS